MKKLFAMLAAVTLVTACSQMPDRITPTPVGHSGYATYSCEGLRREYLANNDELQQLVSMQHHAANGDRRDVAIGTLLVGLPIAAAIASTGPDHAVRIGDLRGRQQAISQAMPHICRE